MNVRDRTAQGARTARTVNVVVDGTVSGGADLKTRADIVAAVAAANAGAVDRDARFPGEAIAAARSQRLLGIMVPHAFGGEGARVTDAADVCYVLGRACASTAMIYAMHQ